MPSPCRYAILVSATSSFDGTKTMIQKSFVVKEHFEVEHEQLLSSSPALDPHTATCASLPAASELISSSIRLHLKLHVHVPRFASIQHAPQSCVPLESIFNESCMCL